MRLDASCKARRMAVQPVWVKTARDPMRGWRGRDWRNVSVTENLPGKCKALGSIPSIGGEKIIKIYNISP
jgi:hypothetical protein